MYLLSLIRYSQGKVIAGLANGSLAFFSHSTGGWNLQAKEEMSLGSPPVQPIRCCLAKAEGLWVGYWNKIHIINVTSRKVEVRLTSKHRKLHLCVCASSSSFFFLVTHFCFLSFWLSFSPPEIVCGVGAWWAAGAFPVSGWEWRLGFLSAGPHPQAFWLGHRAASSTSGPVSHGDQSTRLESKGNIFPLLFQSVFHRNHLQFADSYSTNTHILSFSVALCLSVCPSISLF